jgi:hypothetical protein
MPLAFQHFLGKRKVLDNNYFKEYIAKSRRGSNLDQFGPYIFAVFGRLGYIYIRTI